MIRSHLQRSHLAVAVTAGVFAIGCGGGDGSTRGVQIGAPVPAYSAFALNGDSVSLAGQKGKVILLNVWATWCHPCRAEIPELREVHARYQSRGFDVVGVSVDADGSDEVIAEFAKEFQMQYPIWRDPGERISTRFLIVGVPETFLIDRTGVLRWRKIGPIPPNDSSLVNAIERALAP